MPERELEPNFDHGLAHRFIAVLELRYAGLSKSPHGRHSQPIVGRLRRWTADEPSARGNEREIFVSKFLRDVLPTPFRVGEGDVIDAAGHHSGQLDVVIEYPFMPSIPATSEGPRLYFAEGVAAVIEVKSNIAAQWNEVERTAEKLQSVRRSATALMRVGNSDLERIPLIGVGFKGWELFSTVQEKVATGTCDAILVIDSGPCASANGLATGDLALVLFLEVVHRAVSALKVADTTLERIS